MKYYRVSLSVQRLGTGVWSTAAKMGCLFRGTLPGLMEPACSHCYTAKFPNWPVWEEYVELAFESFEGPDDP